MAAGIFPNTALAQQYFDPGILQRTIESKPDDYEATGARLGAFMFWPGVELVYENNDNVFYDDEFELSDTIWHVRPWLNITSDWTRHALNFTFWADLARYDDFDSLDYDDWALRLDGRVDVRRDSYFTWDVSHMNLHEDRRSPDANRGLYVTEFDYSGYNLAYDHTFNRMQLGARFMSTQFDYKDNVGVGGEIIDNQFRDRDQQSFDVRADYLSRPGRSYFASYTRTEIDYDRIQEDGFNRDSSSDGLGVGISWDLTSLLVGDLYAQWVERKYDDPVLPTVDGYNLGAALNWTPTLLTTVNVRMAGGPQETIQPGSSGYYSRLYSARVQHELRRNWLLNGRVSYTDNDYETIPGFENALNDTQVTRAGLGVTYLMNRHFYLSGGYVYEKQDSNQSQFEYRANKYFLTLGIEL